MKLDLAVGPRTLDDVQEALDTFWSRHDHVPSGVRVQVGIAAAEIAANIIEHGRAAELQMEIEVHPNEVQVEFTDNGDPTEIDLFAIQMPDETAEGGRGLALALTALGLLAHFCDELGNHWRLVSKAFPSAGTPRRNGHDIPNP